MTRSLDEWLRAAQADADHRGLPALKPLLSALADATRTLRDATWNHDPLAPPTSNHPSETTRPRGDQ